MKNQMNPENKCKGIFGFLFGHKFISCHDTNIEYQDNKISENVMEHIVILNGSYQNPILKKSSKYIKSICKRCGKEINKNTNVVYKYKDCAEWFEKNKEELRNEPGYAQKIVQLAFNSSRELK
jgi:hypothetical protein